MADLETLERALRNADAAGDTEAAQAFATEIQKTRSGAAQPGASKEKGFFNEHPTARTALRYGLPLAAGVATMPFTGGMSLPAILALEGGAQLGTEGILQATGVNDASFTDAGIAAVSGPLGRLAGGTIANLPKWLPGFSDAVKGALAPEARGLPGKLLPGDSKAAYTALAQSQKNQVSPRIMGFPALKNAVDELGQGVDNVPWDQLQSKLKMSGQGELFDQIVSTISGAPAKASMVSPTVGGKASLPTGLPKQAVTTPARPAGMTFDEARAGVEGLGRVIRGTSDPAERGVYKKLYGAMLDDLENAPTPVAGSMKLWQEARQAAKMEHARFKLADATEKAITTKDGVDIINPNQVVKWLRTNDEIKSRVSPKEYRAIVNEYRSMASMAGHNMSKAMAILAGFGTGGATGALAAFGGSEILSKAMMTEAGRKTVRKFVGDPSKSTLRRMAMLAGVEVQAALPGEEEEE